MLGPGGDETATRLAPQLSFGSTEVGVDAPTPIRSRPGSRGSRRGIRAAIENDDAYMVSQYCLAAARSDYVRAMAVSYVQQAEEIGIVRSRRHRELVLSPVDQIALEMALFDQDDRVTGSISEDGRLADDGASVGAGEGPDSVRGREDEGEAKGGDAESKAGGDEHHPTLVAGLLSSKELDLAHTNADMTARGKFRPLIFALRERKKNAVRQLLRPYYVELGTGPNRALRGVRVALSSVNNTIGNRTLLDLAADWGNRDVVRWLVSYQQGFTGRNVSLTTRVRLNETDADDRTALHRICNSPTEQVALVKALLRAKAKVSLRDRYGHDPLHYAAAYGHSSIVTHLLQSSANSGTRNNWGQTPMHYAALFGRKGVLLTLLEHGALPSDGDEEERTPLHYAYIMRDSLETEINAIVNHGHVLRRHGAPPAGGDFPHQSVSSAWRRGTSAREITQRHPPIAATPPLAAAVASAGAGQSKASEPTGGGHDAKSTSRPDDHDSEGDGRSNASHDRKTGGGSADSEDDLSEDEERVGDIVVRGAGQDDEGDAGDVTESSSDESEEDRDHVSALPTGFTMTHDVTTRDIEAPQHAASFGKEPSSASDASRGMGDHFAARGSMFGAFNAAGLRRESVSKSGADGQPRVRPMSRQLTSALTRDARESLFSKTEALFPANARLAGKASPSRATRSVMSRHSHVGELTRAEAKQLEALELEQEAIDEVIETLLAHGADINNRDMSFKKPFSTSAKFAWYKQERMHLAQLAANPWEPAYLDAKFQDPRTQEAVNTVWHQKLQCTVIMRLVLWLVFITLLVVLGVHQSGRNSHNAQAFLEGIREDLLFEEWGEELPEAYHDIRSVGDFWKWIDNVFTPAVFEESSYLRTNGTLQPHRVANGSLSFVNHLVGRPRFRQVRSAPQACSYDLDDLLPNMAASVCFDDALGVSSESTATFVTGPREWTWAPKDVPAYIGVADTYPGSGFSTVVPPSLDEWQQLRADLEAHHWLDVSTRAIIMELTVFNPSQAVFANARLGVEFLTGGAVLPTAYVDLTRLLPYLTTSDSIMVAVEVLVLLGMVYYSVYEVRSMLRPWPEYPVAAAEQPVGDEGKQVDGRSRRRPTMSGASHVPGYATRRDHGASRRKRMARPFRKPELVCLWCSRTPPQLRTFLYSAGGEGGVDLGRSQHDVKVARPLARVGNRRTMLADARASATAHVHPTFKLWGRHVYVYKLYSGITVTPYWLDWFSAINVLLLACYVPLVTLHVVTVIRAREVEWSNTMDFIDTFSLAELVVAKTYLLGLAVFLGCLRTLEFLRINRQLSTFLLIIRGMVKRMIAFFVIFGLCLLAFALFDYIAFGSQSTQPNTVMLSLLEHFDFSLGSVSVTRNWGVSRIIGPTAMLVFALLVVYILSNLLIAAMTDQYESVKGRAAAVWCFTQFSMLQDLHEGVDENDDIGGRENGSVRPASAEVKGGASATST